MPTVKLDSTLEMYYEDQCYADPWREPETVILHHGNAKNSQLWYAWTPLLARQYRVVRLDARGFGRSSVPPPGYQWSLSNFCADLLHLMDYLKIEKAHIVGETIGGTIGLKFAHECPERVETLTMCTSPYRFRGVQQYLEYYNLVKEKGVDAWVRQTGSRRVDPNQDPGHHQWYMEQMSKTSQRVVMETLAYLATQDLTDILPEVKTPTLVMVAENSAMNSNDRTAALTELMPDCRLVKIAGASGYVQHTAPEKCVEAWREFVGRVAARQRKAISG